MNGSIQISQKLPNVLISEQTEDRRYLRRSNIIPIGYRMATLSEVALCFAYNPSFNEALKAVSFREVNPNATHSIFVKKRVWSIKGPHVIEPDGSFLAISRSTYDALPKEKRIFFDLNDNQVGGLKVWVRDGELRVSVGHKRGEAFTAYIKDKKPKKLVEDLRRTLYLKEGDVLRVVIKKHKSKRNEIVEESVTNLKNISEVHILQRK
ncbi:MAG: hypothetical protein ABR981_03330 [Candidatus Micrarchaeaceae archaeon]|jgi:hypothetical protein